jgi:hypothetical protein
VEYERILRFASYLLGHINGTGGELDQAPKFKEFLNSDHWLSEYIIELDETFDELWANYGKWTGIEEFSGLGALVLLLVATHGVHAGVNEECGRAFERPAKS